MSKSIFQLLGIPPTDKFSLVTREYKNKLRQLYSNEAIDEGFLQELINAYQRVNSSEKLSYYLKFGPNIVNDLLAIKEGHINLFIPIEIHERPTDLDNYEPPKTTSIVSIFATEDEMQREIHRVQEMVHSCDEDLKHTVLFLDKLESSNQEQFAEKFDFNTLAQRLTNKLAKSHRSQVGLTFGEAEAIANQHSNRSYMVIVEVVVPINYLSGSRYLSEKDLRPYWINANETKRFCLSENTSFSSEEILTVRPMTYYGNSPKFREDETKPDLLWPDGMTVKNKQHGDRVELLQPDTIKDSNQIYVEIMKQMKVFKIAVDEKYPHAEDKAKSQKLFEAAQEICLKADFKNATSDAVKLDCCSKILNAAETCYPHRHKVIRMLLDILFIPLGLVLGGVPFILKAAMTDSLTFFIDKPTNRQEMLEKLLYSPPEPS